MWHKQGREACIFACWSSTAMNFHWEWSQISRPIFIVYCRDFYGHSNFGSFLFSRVFHSLVPQINITKHKGLKFIALFHISFLWCKSLFHNILIGSQLCIHWLQQCDKDPQLGPRPVCKYADWYQEIFLEATLICWRYWQTRYLSDRTFRCCYFLPPHLIFNTTVYTRWRVAVGPNSTSLISKLKVLKFHFF